MDFIFGQLIAGLSYGSTLFLVSAGLTLIFGVTRVVNFAHGSLYMLGAYLAYTITTHWAPSSINFFGGLLLAALTVAVVGALIEVVLLRRLYASPEIFQLLATFGVVLIVQDAVLAIWGPTELFAPRAPGLKGTTEIAGALVPQYSIFVLAVGPAVYALVWLLIKRTRWGLWVRAAAQDRETAGALGLNEPMLFTSVFALGAFLAGLAGALQIPRETVNLQMDLSILIEAFVVVVVGGLGSVTGAFWAALLIGLLHAFGSWWLPQSTLVLIFVVMAVVLILRPHGLLGRAHAPQPAAHARTCAVRAADAALATHRCCGDRRGDRAATADRQLRHRDCDRNCNCCGTGGEPAFRNGARGNRVVWACGVFRIGRICRRACDRAFRGAVWSSVAAGSDRRRRCGAAGRARRAAVAWRLRGDVDTCVRSDPVVNRHPVD